jgi:hypothetical protein
MMGKNWKYMSKNDGVVDQGEQVVAVENNSDKRTLLTN